MTTVRMGLEVVVIPVSDVDRSKCFYRDLGWRLDADIVKGNAFLVQEVTVRLPGRQDECRCPHEP